MSVLLHLGIRIPEGRESDLLSFLRKAIPFYEQPGGIRVRLLQSTADPQCYIEEVEYEDNRAFDADQRRVKLDPEMAQYLEEWRALLSEDPKVETYRDRTGELR